MLTQFEAIAEEELEEAAQEIPDSLFEVVELLLGDKVALLGGSGSSRWLSIRKLINSETLMSPRFSSIFLAVTPSRINILFSVIHLSSSFTYLPVW
jgi:hypothetical protein